MCNGFVGLATKERLATLSSQTSNGRSVASLAGTPQPASCHPATPAPWPCLLELFGGLLHLVPVAVRVPLERQLAICLQ